MSHPSLRLRSLALVAALSLVLAAPSRSASAAGIADVMGALSTQLAAELVARGAAVSIPDFAGLGSVAGASTGRALAEHLEGLLGKQGIGIVRGAPPQGKPVLTVQGEFNQSGGQVRVGVQLKDANAAVLLDLGLGAGRGLAITDPKDVLILGGASGVLPIPPVADPDKPGTPAVPPDTISSLINDPATKTSGPVVSPLGKGFDGQPVVSPFGIQVAVGGQGRTPVQRNGRPTVTLNAGDVYVLKLSNRGDYTVLVDLSIDGINVLFRRQQKGENIGTWVVPPNSTVEIKGWGIDSQRAREFRVVDASAGAATDLGRLRSLAKAGTITAVVYDPEPTPASYETVVTDEGKEIPMATKTNATLRPGRMQAVVTLHYEAGR